ncbi:hypothetical protein AKG11_31695 [Shinella sp. SUS2]|uniref:hypothetical protein n=1 Tax=unclassified Shinella TaxID=2643062 RepID=UPI00067F9318|nr:MULTISPECIES: hypothetical protein [unclassified Shinella]KNY12991.1 hypothetical protein AKG11_31695 [Shinella sp. SUS2]KOC71704.1 hypothetical protein AKG10_31495 [Shinella sp. GWS1]
MKLPPYHPTRLVGNIAALVLLALGGAYLLDHIARWFGGTSNAFCATVAFFAPLSFSIGVVLCTVGVLVWAASRFKGDAGVGLMIGGALLSVLPGVMPRYFAMECVFTP